MDVRDARAIDPAGHHGTGPDSWQRDDETHQKFSLPLHTRQERGMVTRQAAASHPQYGKKSISQTLRNEVEWSGLTDSRGIAAGRLAAAAEDSDSDMELSGAPSPSSSEDENPRQKKRKPSADEGTRSVDPPRAQASERPWSLWSRPSRAAAPTSSDWWG